MSDVSNLKEIFTSNLAQLRESRGLTQPEMAGHLGIDTRKWQKYEYGENLPKLLMIERIATFFGVKPADLFRDPTQEISQTHQNFTPNLPSFLAGLAVHADAAELLAQLPKDSQTVVNFKAMARSELGKLQQLSDKKKA